MQPTKQKVQIGPFILKIYNVRIGNVLNTVKNVQIMVSIVNTSEETTHINTPIPEDLNHESYQGAQSMVTTSVATVENHEVDRLSEIRKVIATDHLNSEERGSLWKICREFSDVFHLEGDPFPATSAIQHEIRLREGATPVNIRPYRLPYTHRQEIIRQTVHLERDYIIQPKINVN